MRSMRGKHRRPRTFPCVCRKCGKKLRGTLGMIRPSGAPWGEPVDGELLHLNRAHTTPDGGPCERSYFGVFRAPTDRT